MNAFMEVSCFLGFSFNLPIKVQRLAILKKTRRPREFNYDFVGATNKKHYLINMKNMV